MWDVRRGDVTDDSKTIFTRCLAGVVPVVTVLQVRTVRADLFSNEYGILMQGTLAFDMSCCCKAWRILQEQYK